MTLEIDVLGDGSADLRLRGEVDLSTAPSFTDALTAQAAAGGSVRVDLDGVTFMDSTGVKALISATQRLDPGAELILIAPPPQLERLFELTRLDRIPGIRIERPV